MRILPCIFSIFLSIQASSQDTPKVDTSVNLIQVNSISLFVDSIRTKIFSDTLKFKQSDIIGTNKGNRNVNSYSPLFFINILYQYKLDIVTGSEVLAFANEILVSDKIQSISLLSDLKSQKVFGINGKNGVIIIDLKGNAQVNFNVAGFKKSKNTGNNYYQAISTNK